MAADFHLPENPDYTLRDSARDSVLFAHRCLEPADGGRWRAISSFVDTEGRPQAWHDFGTLEGPGWAANALGGAHLLYIWGGYDHCHILQQVALGLLDHVLEDGYLQSDGFIWGYRDTATGARLLNFKHNDDWFCPGSMARIALQMLWFADCLPVADGRRQRLLESAAATAAWLDANVALVDGWYPRRCTPSGQPYPFAAEGGDDPIFARSGDGLHIPWLIAELTARDLWTRDTAPARSALDQAMARGGIYGSVNHDTYDLDENVAHAIAFRTFRAAGAVFDTDRYRAFAYTALEGLDRFKMCEDRNGVATRGLLYMEDSWDTAYLWENAEAAIAYLDAYDDSGEGQYLCWGVTILRAIARHHYGTLGFLTEGVDWNNHVGREHHIDGAEFGAIRYTEPLLNNLHHIEPIIRCLVMREICD